MGSLYQKTALVAIAIKVRRRTQVPPEDRTWGGLKQAFHLF